jgi:DNA-directed RNA polymerase subunit M/transcription elongation factor TFIIS
MSEDIEVSEFVRSKVREKFSDLFDSEYVDELDRVMNDSAMERFSLLGPDQRSEKMLNEYYKQLFIKVYYNINFNKNSVFILRNLEDGSFNISDLVSGSRETLFPEKWSDLHKIRTGTQKKRRKGAHQCKKCSSWFTEHVEMQTRSADESMTISVWCLDCDHRWKYN